MRVDLIDMLLLAVFSINVLLSFIIYTRGKKKRINQIFSLIVLSIALWTISLIVYLNQVIPSKIVLWANFSFLAVSIIPSLLVYFSYVFPLPNSWPIKKNNFLIFIPPVLIGLLAINLKITISAVSVIDYEYGFGYLIFSFYFVIFLGFAFLKLFHSYQTMFGIARMRVKYVLLGTFIFAVVGIIFSLFLPAIGVKNLVVYGPLYSIILVVFITYAITRYRLMDIRLIVFRSVVFGSIIFVTAGIFSVISALITNIFTNLVGIRSSIISSLIVVVLITIFYQALRGLIEKATNTFLYKKRYNPDHLIAKITRVTSSILDIKHLLTSIFRILGTAFQFEKVGIAFLTKDKKFEIEFEEGFEPGEAEGLVNFPNILPILSKVIKQNKGIIVISELKTRYDNGEYQPISPKLLLTMHEKNFDLVVPLYVKEQLIGVLLLGTKKSGDAYTNEDLRVLRIIAGQVAIAIENARLYDDLKDFNIKLGEQVRIKTAQLRHANTELKQLDTAKSEFISIASHQLRTPLTVIKGYISMMREGSFGAVPPKIMDNLEKVYISNERLIGLVENLLDISRIESGHQEYQWSKVQLEDLAQNIVDNLKRTAKDKKLKLFFHRSKKPAAKVTGDEAKLHEVMINFIDNAIKYTEKGEINVYIDTKPEGRVTFCVKDTGRGIAPEIKPHLFQKFSRGKGSFRVHTEGIGLGLYVAKMLIDAHGGKIWAESEGRDKGSRFCFSLPLDFKPKEVKPKE